MARLILLDQTGEMHAFELNLGVNRIGRAPDNHFPIDHATISLLHCEVELDGSGLTFRDLGSTNGSFVDGQRVRHAQLLSGQHLRLGSVEMLVEYSDVKVVIPEFRTAVAPPIMKMPTGESVCLHHQELQAVWKCERCGHLLCTACIHRLRRRGGTALYLCPDCSGPCEVLPEFAKPKKRSWFGFLREKALSSFATTRKMGNRRARR